MSPESYSFATGMKQNSRNNLNFSVDFQRKVDKHNLIITGNPQYRTPKATSSVPVSLPEIPQSQIKTQILRTNLVQGATIQSLLEYQRIPESQNLDMKFELHRQLQKYEENMHLYNNLKTKLQQNKYSSRRVLRKIDDSHSTMMIL